MKKVNLLLILIFSACSWQIALGQTLIVQPYLQDAEPNSIYILWETDINTESIVEWGLSDSLGFLTEGTFSFSAINSIIHEVKLENLDRFTKYYYRVRTGDAVSEIKRFKTPPFAGDNQPFRIIAMSDMQQDNAHPNKFNEIVEEGIIKFLTNTDEEELIDNAGLILIPGDLVQNGNNYNSWASTFFEPGQELFSQVPVYPVPGNHENNSIHFFHYFKLPNNGTAGFEEHWWYKDYGNVRIIGLDSNNPFSNQEQLDWLDDLLNETCAADSIDFVFAQLHHPHKSELWTPGESDYTGLVLDKLGEFSTACLKPSAHFFGHTHGYSRGNSRDHRHLWVNVATAGGAIDNWGEFPNYDYDEFSVSTDDYGFVSIEIKSGNDPSMVLKRISRGDQDLIVDNEVRDSIILKLHPTEISKPTAFYPINETLIPECVELKAGPFNATAKDASHGQSHWQVSLQGDGFENLVFESWKNFENWYFEEDTQAGDDLKDEIVAGLSGNQDYQWRVRYRDKQLNWSPWSDPQVFSTSASVTLPNLLLNPGAEDTITNWKVETGVFESLTNGVCDGISAFEGERYFSVGGICEHSPVGICIQLIDISSYQDSINTGAFPVNFGGYLSNYAGIDQPEMRLIFLDANGLTLGESDPLSSLNAYWTKVSHTMHIPIGTNSIIFELKGTRYGGTDNDSYFDKLYLSLGQEYVDCGNVSKEKHLPTSLTILDVYPNPITKQGTIVLPHYTYQSPTIQLINIAGTKQVCNYQYKANQIKIDASLLEPGIYMFNIRDAKKFIGSGKFIKR